MQQSQQHISTHLFVRYVVLVTVALLLLAFLIRTAAM
jgi:hypothetical protein